MKMEAEFVSKSVALLTTLNQQEACEFFLSANVFSPVAQTPRPQIANPKFATNNPTLTTIALEKPFCVFDGSMLKGTDYDVYLYVMADSGKCVCPVHY